MRLTFAMLMMPLALSGCVNSPSETVVLDRARKPLALCAGALAGDSIEAARAECVPAIAVIEAGAGW